MGLDRLRIAVGWSVAAVWVVSNLVDALNNAGIVSTNDFHTTGMTNYLMMALVGALFSPSIRKWKNGNGGNGA